MFNNFIDTFTNKLEGKFYSFFKVIFLIFIDLKDLFLVITLEHLHFLEEIKELLLYNLLGKKNLCEVPCPCYKHKNNARNNSSRPRGG